MIPGIKWLPPRSTPPSWAENAPKFEASSEDSDEDEEEEDWLADCCDFSNPEFNEEKPVPP